MARTEQVTCDQCNRDLTYAMNVEDYCVVLMAETKTHIGGVVTDMAVCPWPEQPMHFCGRGCLMAWAQEEMKVVRIEGTSYG